MFKYLIQGLMLGLAYVAPIGMQNLYVINAAISQKRARAYQIAAIVILFDISLALAAFFGMGLLMDKSQLLKAAILVIGSIMVVYIGIQLIKSTPDTQQDINMDKPLLQIITSCFAVTWLNPQALIDGSLLLGGFKASLPEGAAKLFIMGVCLASTLWFSSLTTIVSIFRNSFNNKIVKIINIVCGSVIVYYGLKLGYSFIKTIA